MTPGLFLTEFINSLNNSISGLYVVINHGQLQDGPVCELNGWVGQFSVQVSGQDFRTVQRRRINLLQAADFSILAISVVTLLTIQLKSYIIYASTAKQMMTCFSVWIVPLITSTF